MPWMETDYSEHTHYRWKIKWRLEHLGALGIMVAGPFNIQMGGTQLSAETCCKEVKSFAFSDGKKPAPLSLKVFLK